MTRKILIVDDEESVLESLAVALRKQFEVYTALGPVLGLKAIQGPETFAVVVSDLKMPSMDGVTFLSRVRELSPDTVRIMLTGFADVEVAMGAVNEGQVFRFLTKPCPRETLAKALEAGLEQHRLLMAERELLRGTLRGSIQLLTDALTLANPEAYGRANRIRSIVRRLAKAAGIPVTWELDLAAMLSQIGCMALPREVLEKISKGIDLSPEERELYDSHPKVGAALLENIPRLAPVAEIIALQHERHDDCACPGKHLPARLLKLATDYDMLESRGMAPADIITSMGADTACYEPVLFQAMAESFGQRCGYTLKRVMISELAEGMVLEEGIVSEQGLLLLAKGTEISPMTMERMRQSALRFQVVEPVTVRLPTHAHNATQAECAGEVQADQENPAVPKTPAAPGTVDGLATEGTLGP